VIDLLLEREKALNVAPNKITGEWADTILRWRSHRATIAITPIDMTLKL